MNNERIRIFQIGSRVQAHPATDTWMRGNRWGTVVKIPRTRIHVTMDVSSRTIRFHPSNLLLQGE